MNDRTHRLGHRSLPHFEVQDVIRNCCCNLQMTLSRTPGPYLLACLDLRVARALGASDESVFHPLYGLPREPADLEDVGTKTIDRSSRRAGTTTTWYRAQAPGSSNPVQQGHGRLQTAHREIQPRNTSPSSRGSSPFPYKYISLDDSCLDYVFDWAPLGWTGTTP